MSANKRANQVDGNGQHSMQSNVGDNVVTSCAQGIAWFMEAAMAASRSS